jgi:hypothetical protein
LASYPEAFITGKILDNKKTKLSNSTQTHKKKDEKKQNTNALKRKNIERYHIG